MVDRESSRISRSRRLQDEIWKLPAADAHFARQREQADNADLRQKYIFFEMMKEIGDELQKEKQIIPRSNNTEHFAVLDLCMAPGGYSATVLKHCPSAQISGISLPIQDGGHRLLLEDWQSDPPCLDDRPFLNCSFDLVFCDGQVLYRQNPLTPSQSKDKATRLTTAQLILALQRIRPGGTLVILLHRLSEWKNVRLLRSLSLFADIELFKPKRKHATRGSFYLVAKNVNPEHPEALRALETWKWTWWAATVKEGCGEDSSTTPPEAIEE
ncbi:hypothetical protein VTN77DRAFT_3873 [Rasamsonia byssochlamydoides]|uniref:uncharacterized protein n=1 Tax=Rasamsonia byssochlamydoides TaxID=89139 RepID=UPI0037443C02